MFRISMQCVLHSSELESLDVFEMDVPNEFYLFQNNHEVIELEEILWLQRLISLFFAPTDKTKYNLKLKLLEKMSNLVILLFWFFLNINFYFVDFLNKHSKKA